MKLFVTGATGVIGRRAVPLLINRGHRVTAIGRSRESAAMLQSWGADPVFVDLFDRSALMKAIAEHDAVVILARSVVRFIPRRAAAPFGPPTPLSVES